MNPSLSRARCQTTPAVTPSASESWTATFRCDHSVRARKALNAASATSSDCVIHQVVLARRVRVCEGGRQRDGPRRLCLLSLAFHLCPLPYTFDCEFPEGTREQVTITENDLQSFEERLGYSFIQPQLLRRAVTHKSFSHESRSREIPDNETYEFLGDSVLGFVIGDILFQQFPTLDEGALSKMKAYLVSAGSLALKSRDLGMGEVLHLGVGEEKSGGRNKDSLLANLFEAMIAAVYLDGGVDPARALIARSFAGDLKAIDPNDLKFQDYKTALQEMAQGNGLPLPEYSVVGEIGPDHDKRFVVEVRVNDEIVTRGEGSSKKEAQQQAARRALDLDHESLRRGRL